jgi:hypothetical protein
MGIITNNLRLLSESASHEELQHSSLDILAYSQSLFFGTVTQRPPLLNAR